MILSVKGSLYDIMCMSLVKVGITLRNSDIWKIRRKQGTFLL